MGWLCTDMDSDSSQKIKENPMVGAFGWGGASYDKIMITVETPLTEGFALNRWISINSVGRQVTGAPSAITVAVARGTNRISPSFEAPFLLYNQLGKGACIYLVGGGNIPLVKNILSETTLRWLAGD